MRSDSLHYFSEDVPFGEFQFSHHPEMQISDSEWRNYIHDGTCDFAGTRETSLQEIQDHDVHGAVDDVDFGNSSDISDDRFANLLHSPRPVCDYRESAYAMNKALL